MPRIPRRGDPCGRPLPTTTNALSRRPSHSVPTAHHPNLPRRGHLKPPSLWERLRAGRVGARRSPPDLFSRGRPLRNRPRRQRTIRVGATLVVALGCGRGLLPCRGDSRIARSYPPNDLAGVGPRLRKALRGEKIEMRGPLTTTTAHPIPSAVDATHPRRGDSRIALPPSCRRREETSPSQQPPSALDGMQVVRVRHNENDPPRARLLQRPAPGTTRIQVGRVEAGEGSEEKTVRPAA